MSAPGRGRRRGSAGQGRPRGGGSASPASGRHPRVGKDRGEPGGGGMGEKREGREEDCGRRRGGDSQESGWGAGGTAEIIKPGRRGRRKSGAGESWTSGDGAEGVSGAGGAAVPGGAMLPGRRRRRL